MKKAGHPPVSIESGAPYLWASILSPVIRYLGLNLIIRQIRRRRHRWMTGKKYKGKERKEERKKVRDKAKRRQTEQ